MATFYLDYENGNDAAAGTSWATAWKTAQNGPTAARTTPGDIIRIAKSPDPTSVGTATWTHAKIGNSITFSSAPTRFLTGGTSGWVTSSTTTVTNNQLTAYILQGTVSCTTSSDTDLMYKNLGSTLDLSAYQQLCFWFRPATAFDCSGAQNMFIRLCSDTLGTTVVDTLTMPKWNYSAGNWYPLVINKGSALGSNIQSISITTTSATSQQFFFDEFFVSPANGLTLWSLIGKHISTAAEQYDWYPIKTVRDADVWLHGVPTYSAAGSASGTNGVDPSYMGTTETVTTYKRETIKVLGSAGPNSSALIIVNEAGTATTTTVSPITWSGGWDTATNTQTGESWLDNLVQLAPGISQSQSYNVFEKIGLVRTGQAVSTSSLTSYTDMSFVGNSTVTINSNSYDIREQLSVNWTVNSFIANTSNTILGNTTISNAHTLVRGNVWGGGIFTFGSFGNATVAFKNIYPITTNTILLSTQPSYNSVISFGKIATPRITGSPSGINYSLGLNNATLDVGMVYNIESIDVTTGASGINASGNAVYNVGEFFGAGAAAIATAPNLAVINGGQINCVLGPVRIPTTSNPTYTNMVFHNYNNVVGTARIYQSANNNVSVMPYFELQSSDVRTGGSKAWKLFLQGLPTGALGGSNDLTGAVFKIKLASVAAEANKLVTVNCYVKRSNTNHTAGIFVDGVSGLLPGYTTNQTSNCSSSGSFENLSVTFTPTQDCVFDLYAYTQVSSSKSSMEVVWDDLTITQAP